VGGAQWSDPADCLVYAVDLGVPVLIDCGAGPGWPQIRRNMQAAGFDPASVHTLVLTHCHVDHIGAAAELVAESGCTVAAHALDADAIQTGDGEKTAALWYNLKLEGTKVGRMMYSPEETLSFPNGSLKLIHTPGHTPGSIVAVAELDGQRVLFGQDIHGPFDPAFGSDIQAWRQSMKKLIELEADILCEGHYGIFQPADRVRHFIERHLAMHSR
jgi:glyoxylase-like metal-dependent hydrolase (beta-lactamase superfamily II)